MEGSRKWNTVFRNIRVVKSHPACKGYQPVAKWEVNFSKVASQVDKLYKCKNMYSLVVDFHLNFLCRLHVQIIRATPKVPLYNNSCKYLDFTVFWAKVHIYHKSYLATEYWDWDKDKDKDHWISDYEIQFSTLPAMSDVYCDGSRIWARIT